MTVPNQFPSIATNKYRIAVIGEAPGRDEEVMGRPFVGASGKLLKDILGKVGLPSDTLFFGNICQHRPLNNEIENFAWDSYEIQSGLAQLASDLQEFNPHLCILLGKTALFAATGRSDITNQRGSIFLASLVHTPFTGRKCLATYHPAAILRVYEWRPFLAFDLRRAADEGQSPHWEPPYRDIIICKSTAEVAACFSNVEKCKCGTDIEGYVADLQCIGIADQPSHAFVIPFKNAQGDSFWSLEDEKLIWRMLASWLESPLSSKVWQNGLYDRFILQYSYQIIPRNNTDDTMLQWHEKYCELPKSLATMTSVLTKEPFYKQERKSEDWETKLRYCGKDACVTLESHLQLLKSPSTTSLTNEQSNRHYLFNCSILNPLLYMEIRGMAYDGEKAKARREETLKEMYEAQVDLDKETGVGILAQCGEDRDSIFRLTMDTMCYKRNKMQPKKEYQESFPRVREILHLSTWTKAEIGELSTLLNVHCNVDSPRFTQLLYNKLCLPLQINNKTKQPTSDYHALLKLVKKTDSLVCKHALKIRDTSTHAGMLGIYADDDGRIRCGYNSVGTETGRLTCYTSPTGSGYNLQTIPKKDRDLFRADMGYTFFQCDLSGADGWTVAAWCKRLGDPTMLDDYLYGLKPAKILVLMLKYGKGINEKSREELKSLSKEVNQDDWNYFACKRVQHGTCYLMGERRLGEQVFMDSEGALLLEPQKIHLFQQLFFLRYRGVKLWHNYVERQIAKTPVMTAASGLTRRFFGRRDQILGEALAFEPQANTTYATNMAMFNLWNDQENHRRPNHDNPTNGNQTVIMRPRIEPLHQVHDAIVGQFSQDDTQWAIGRIKSYFSTPLQIAGQTITIPFEMGLGPSWGELKEVK